MSVQLNGQVNNTQQLNKILKTLQSGKGVKTQKTMAPEMTMNGSIFNLVSKNQTKANGAQPTMRKPASPAATGTQSTSGVVAANTKASVDDVQGTKPKVNSPSVQDIKSGEVPDEFKKVEVGDTDFSNLGSYSDVQLKSLKHDLQEMLDNDVPFFLRAPYEAKLDKVEAELETRAEESGNRVDEDKDDKKSNDDITADAKSGTATAKSGAAEAQKGTAQLNDMSSRTISAEKDLKSAQAKMEKQQAAGQKEVNQNLKSIDKEQQNIDILNEENDLLSTEIEEANAEIETAAAEIESSQGAGARTRGAAVGSGAEESISTGEEGVSADTGKIETLQTKVETANAKLAVNNARIGKSTVAIKKYQTANNKTVRTLTKANKAYTRTVNQAQKQLQTDETKQGNFEETMNKINDVSSKVALAGTVAKYAGMALRSTGWPPTVAVGVYMEATGVVAEAAGNYGVAAANVGLAASNIAKGNIMGALTSAGTAFMAGASAVNSTKAISASVKEGIKAGTKNLIGAASKKATTEATKTGLSGLANKVASSVGKPKLMEIGSTLMNAASVFTKKDDGGTQTQQATGTARFNRGFSRRKIA